MKPAASRLVFLLAGVGGCVDAVGFLILGGLFVSHMSGNSAALGAYLGQGNLALGLPHLFAVPVFVCGLFCGYLFTTRNKSLANMGWVLVFEAGLLVLFIAGCMFGGEPLRGSWAYYLLGLPALFAMGLQNSTLKKIGDANVHTTYVTGVLDAMCEASASAFWEKENRVGRLRIAGASAATWLAYIFGALFGSWAILGAGALALLPAVGVLCFVAVRLIFGKDR